MPLEIAGLIVPLAAEQTLSVAIEDDTTEYLGVVVIAPSVPREAEDEDG